MYNYSIIELGVDLYFRIVSRTLGAIKLYPEIILQSLLILDPSSQEPLGSGMTTIN